MDRPSAATASVQARVTTSTSKTARLCSTEGRPDMAGIANDNFESYFAEKIWELIPAFYRDRDGSAANPGVLRGIVEIMAAQAAVLRRSNDHLWDDEFIDLCNSWAVPYI